MAKKKDVHMKRNRTSAAGQILLSISILVSGREETTKDCINSLDRLRAKVPCELILTDTGCPAEIQEWLRKKADKHKGQVEKYGFWGLVLFVGIPLPGTGAWTGSLVASLLHMKIRKSFPAILLGIMIATVIMSLLSYGLIGAILQ